MCVCQRDFSSDKSISSTQMYVVKTIILVNMWGCSAQPVEEPKQLHVVAPTSLYNKISIYDLVFNSGTTLFVMHSSYANAKEPRIQLPLLSVVSMWSFFWLCECNYTTLHESEWRWIWLAAVYSKASSHMEQGSTAREVRLHMVIIYSHRDCRHAFHS